MDGDVFSKVRRIGRDAGAAIIRALNGEEWDPFCAERCLERLLNTTHGLPSLAGVLRELRDLNALPLLAITRREECVRRIAEFVAVANGSVLDLQLRDISQSCVLRGISDERAVVTRFCEAVLHKAIISGRGGLLEEAGAGRVQGARALPLPIAAAAAEELLRRPDAQRLGLSRRHPRLTPDSNLLGGPE